MVNAEYESWDNYCKKGLGPKNQYLYVGNYLSNAFDKATTPEEKKNILDEALRLYVKAGIEGTKVDPEVKNYKKKLEDEKDKIPEENWDGERRFHEKEKLVLTFFAKTGSIIAGNNAWFSDEDRNKWIEKVNQKKEMYEGWAKNPDEADKERYIKLAQQFTLTKEKLTNKSKNPEQWENVLDHITTIWDEEAKKNAKITERDEKWYDMKVIKHFGILLEALLSFQLENINKNQQLPPTVFDPLNKDEDNDLNMLYYMPLYKREAITHRKEFKGELIHNWVNYFKNSLTTDILQVANPNAYDVYNRHLTKRKKLFPLCQKLQELSQTRKISGFNFRGEILGEHRILHKNSVYNDIPTIISEDDLDALFTEFTKIIEEMEKLPKKEEA